MEIRTVYDIQQLLKKFGIFVYIGDRVADLELMEEELKDLYRAQLVEKKVFETAIMRSGMKSEWKDKRAQIR